MVRGLRVEQVKQGLLQIIIMKVVQLLGCYFVEGSFFA